MKHAPIHILRGFLMGAADVVPGVSGGTVALVLGIYERLVASIKAGSSTLGRMIRGDWGGMRRWLQKVDWPFLIPLLGGILLAVLSLARILESLLRDYPEEMAGAFAGLIAGSVVIAWRLVRRWNPPALVVAVAIAVATFYVLGLREGERGRWRRRRC